MISRHKLLNMTAIHRGQNVKLIREFPYDKLSFDYLTGLLIAQIEDEFFQISPNFIEALWTRNLRFYPSQSIIPFGYVKICSWNISKPLSFVVIDRHLLYMFNEKFLYIMPICNHNEIKLFRVLENPSIHIPFYLFPQKESLKSKTLINYKDRFFPISVILHILTVIFVLLFIFKKKSVKVCQKH